MNARRVAVTSILVLAASVAVAALKHGPAEPSSAEAAADCEDTIPRIVVVARRGLAQSEDSRIARVVVTAKRIESAAAESPRRI